MSSENFYTDENFRKVMEFWSDYGSTETARKLGMPKHRVASIARKLGLQLSPVYYAKRSEKNLMHVFGLNESQIDDIERRVTTSYERLEDIAYSYGMDYASLDRLRISRGWKRAEDFTSTRLDLFHKHTEAFSSERVVRERENRKKRRVEQAKELSVNPSPKAGLLADGSGSYMLQLRQELEDIETELDATMNFQRIIELQRKRSMICVRLDNMVQNKQYVAADTI